MKKKETKIEKLRANFIKNRLKEKNRLLSELNYEPIIVEPKYRRIIIYDNLGRESYNTPKYLDKFENLYRA